MMLARYVPLARWLVYLASGWRFATDPVIEPMRGHHGHYSVLMVRGGGRARGAAQAARGRFPRDAHPDRQPGRLS